MFCLILHRRGSLLDAASRPSGWYHSQMTMFPTRDAVTSSRPSEEKTSPKTDAKPPRPLDSWGFAPFISKAVVLGSSPLRPTNMTEPSLNPTAATSPDGDTRSDRPSARRPLDRK